eukprot:4392957-Amphidinium_carterae.1
MGGMQPGRHQQSRHLGRPISAHICRSKLAAPLPRLCTEQLRHPDVSLNCLQELSIQTTAALSCNCYFL